MVSSRIWQSYVEPKNLVQWRHSGSGSIFPALDLYGLVKFLVPVNFGTTRQLKRRGPAHAKSVEGDETPKDLHLHEAIGIFAGMKFRRYPFKVDFKAIKGMVISNLPESYGFPIMILGDI